MTTIAGRPTLTAAVRAEGISKRYGTGRTAVRALSDVTVAFPSGEFAAVMGPSGSGKSTLLHCLAGVDDVDEGSVYIGDVPINNLDERSLTRLRRERVRFVFQSLDVRARLRHRPVEPSGGQRQRVAVTKAIASRPDIVFADEPTENLDSRTSVELLQFMRRSVDDFGQTIVMVTHDVMAASYADRVVFLHGGRIVDDVPASLAAE